jgi:hypothetical protein
MTRFIHLALLTGLIGLSFPQILACGDDSKDKKKDKDEDEDKDDDGDGADYDASQLCEDMAKGAESEGEEVSADEMAECKSGMKEKLADLDDDGWNDLGKCIDKAESEDDAGGCVKEAMMSTGGGSSDGPGGSKGKATKGGGKASTGPAGGPAGGPARSTGKN